MRHQGSSSPQLRGGCIKHGSDNDNYYHNYGNMFTLVLPINPYYPLPRVHQDLARAF